jgi:hypothetical protein
MQFRTLISLAMPAVLSVMLVCVCCNPAAAAEGLKITEMAVTTKIVKGHPIDAVRRISSTSVKVLYCFTRIVNESGEETTIKHVWYHNGQKLRESEFPVKGKKWRTYSVRDIDKESVGNWKVDVLDIDGNLLKSVEFRIN